MTKKTIITVSWDANKLEHLIYVNAQIILSAKTEFMIGQYADAILKAFRAAGLNAEIVRAKL